MINLLKLFSDIFDPQPGETALVLIDTPHGTLSDTAAWEQRRAMAQRWRAALGELGRRRGFQVLDLAGFPATGSPVTMSGATVYYFDALNRICGHWQIVDRLGVYQQLRRANDSR